MMTNATIAPADHGNHQHVPLWLWPLACLRSCRFELVLLLVFCGTFGLCPVGAQETQSDSPVDSSEAATAAQPVTRLQVDKLLAALDGNKLASRQQAEKDLIALGPAVLDFLPAGETRLSAEASQRLRRVRQVLQEALAKQAAGAKLIRLGDVTSMDAALTRLSDLSGVPFEVADGFNPTIDLQLSSPQTFWINLDTVLDAAGADVNFYIGDPGELGISPRTEGRPSRTDTAAYAGVFRLEATSVVSRRDFHNPQLSGISVSGEIAWEPRMTPIGLTIPLDTIVAVLDDGQRIRPDEGELTIAANAAIPFAQFSVPLPLPTDAPEKITSLTGTVRSILPGAREHFQIDLSRKHEGERAGSVTVLVEDVRANNALHEVRVEIAFTDAGKALESHRQWIFDNPAYVTDENGQRLEVLGTQTYRQAADRVGISYIFDLGESPQGKTFHYETPISIVENEVEFVMREIVLP